jgi:hypothetical protein
MNIASTSPLKGSDLFRLVTLALLLGQMWVYYDTSPRTIPLINAYLLGNLVLILLTVAPWRAAPALVWASSWLAGALLRWDWATRATNSDVFWATSQGVDFLLRGLNPYTQVYTWVYEHQPGISNYPSYSYYPGGLFAEIPFYLLGNVRYGLALADLGTALLIYLLARSRVGAWPARALALFWLLFLPGFQIPLLLGVLDFLLLFWIALAVWLYVRGQNVGSALAAAMALTTKQYGFLFAVPWGILLLRPAALALIEKWRGADRGWRLFSTIPQRLWIPPLALAGLSALVVFPLALLSPHAFLDATIAFHAKQPPAAELGTPQWNQSLAGQMVGLGWIGAEQAQTVAAVTFALLLLGLTTIAALKIRHAPSALMWSALLAALSFAFNSGRVHFFYWRIVLLLFLLYFVLSGNQHRGSQAPDVQVR